MVPATKDERVLVKEFQYPGFVQWFCPRFKQPVGPAIVRPFKVSEEGDMGRWESIEERRAARLLSLGDRLYASAAMAWCMALAIFSSDASVVQNGGMA